MPQQWYGGYIQVEKPPVPDPSNTIAITVTFGGEKHVFQFLQTKGN